jgi:hypothetical protein
MLKSSNSGFGFEIFGMLDLFLWLSLLLLVTDMLNLERPLTSISDNVKIS